MELTTAMLADGAHLANGKLYILGGQWDRLGGIIFPLQHPAMAVVLVVKVEYDEALTTHPVNIELTIDGRAVGVSAQGELTIGHAPIQARGAPTFVPLALTFNNVTFDVPGRYEWVVTIDGEPIGHIPIEVARTNPPGYPMPTP